MVLQFVAGSAAFLARKAIMKKILAKKPNISQKALLAIATNATRVKFGDIVLKRKGKSKTKSKKIKNSRPKNKKKSSTGTKSKPITPGLVKILDAAITQTEKIIGDRIGK